MFNASFLFASLIWGSIGLGYFVYGKRRQSISAMAGGMLMMVGAYFIDSALLMSLASLAIMAAVYFLVKSGN